VQNFEWWWWPPLERPYLLAFCEQNDIGIVHLYRENVIEATVSSAIADQRKIWHSWEAGADARVSQKYKLNIKALMHRAKLLEQQSQLFKRWTGSNRKLEITYEELAAGIGRGGAIESRIGEFLGSKPRRAFEPRHQKLTPPLRDVVENFEELKAACRAEGLGRYLA
jgi:LPS sulfotransferase NodH